MGQTLSSRPGKLLESRGRSQFCDNSSPALAAPKTVLISEKQFGKRDDSALTAPPSSRRDAPGDDSCSRKSREKPDPNKLLSRTAGTEYFPNFQISQFGPPELEPKPRRRNSTGHRSKGFDEGTKVGKPRADRDRIPGKTLPQTGQVFAARLNSGLAPRPGAVEVRQLGGD